VGTEDRGWGGIDTGSGDPGSNRSRRNSGRTRNLGLLRNIPHLGAPGVAIARARTRAPETTTRSQHPNLRHPRRPPAARTPRPSH